jgi:carbon monoxide dehydrogenase subunit G
MFQRLHFVALSLLFLAFPTWAAEPEIQVNVEKRGEVFVVDSTFDLAVPLRTAWGVFTDFDNMASIMSNLTSSKVTNRSGNLLQVQQEGVAKFGFFSYSFNSEREIQLLPMKKILARQLSGNAKNFTSEMELSRQGSATRVRYHAEMSLESMIARTFGGSFIEHEIAEQFTAMAAEMARRKMQQALSQGNQAASQ